MSRSIHTTRRDVAELEATEFSRAEQRAEALARARRELAQKRRVKTAILRERRRAASGVTAADTIPVVVTGTGKHIHHVASAEDVRQVLRRLPPGVVDGLTRVELQLGAEYQVDAARRDEASADPDPLVGRLGYETFPGVWSGHVLGTYWPATAVIGLYAHVFDAAAPLRDVWETMLRLRTLATLVHEVGHHYDNTMRVARGRWLARGHDRVEMYAEAREHVWLHSVVVPYLREAYPAEVERLESWIAHHGGVRLPFEAIAGDARSTRKGGYFGANETFWAVRQFVEELVKDVLQGVPLQECRVQFARNLHYRDDYAEAHRALDVVLAEDLLHVGALTLRADILVHEGRDEEALAIAQGVLARAADHADAWEVVADAYEALERWEEAHAAASRMVDLYAEDKRRRFHALAQRVRAAIRLGRLDGARADFARLDAEYPRWVEARWIKRLRAELDAAASAAGT